MQYYCLCEQFHFLSYGYSFSSVNKAKVNAMVIFCDHNLEDGVSITQYDVISGKTQCWT